MGVVWVCRYLFKYIIIGDTGMVPRYNVIIICSLFNGYNDGFLGNFQFLGSGDGWTASFGIVNVEASSLLMWIATWRRCWQVVPPFAVYR